MARLKDILPFRQKPREKEKISDAKKYLSIRTEVIDKLQEQAKHGIIHLKDGGGRKAHEDVIQAGKEYNETRRKLLEHELATHYRVMVSGSARISPESPEYSFTKDLTQALVQEIGIDIINGAGPGIMGAAALGARKARDNGEQGNINSRNIGIGIKLPYEEEADPNLDSYQEHTEYTTRIQEMIDMSHAAYFGPGGVGTALELVMVMQLKQSHHLESDYPIIVSPFWRKTVEDFHTMMYEDRLKNGLDPLIKQEDLQVTFSDNVQDIVCAVKENYDNWNATIGQHVRRGRFAFLRRKSA